MSTGMAHQQLCLDVHGRKRAFALFADMGTGKTWIAMMNACRLWERGECETLLVLAPNGVQTNWTEIELPKHMPTDVRWCAASWSSDNKKAEQQAVDDVCRPSATGTMRILTMNWEAIQTKRGMACALKFCQSSPHLMIVCDESDNVGNPRAQRTKALMKLRPYSQWRRIMTGTPIDGTPFSLFSQFAFLDPQILRTTSYTAYKAQYAEMLAPTDPLLLAIVKKGRLRFTPQIVASGPDGRPRYRNLDKLKALIDPHTFFVTKEECLDLPAKVYKTVTFKLTPQQAVVYEKCKKECRIMLGEEDTPITRLTVAMKLSQITSGYYMHPDSDVPVRIPGETPKLTLLVQRVKAIVDAGNQVIIWARYTVEIEDIAQALGAESIRTATYYGKTRRDDRQSAINAFEQGQVSVFIGNQQAGGTGITLVAANVVMYFSNNFRLRDRLQSEDRAHRIGQTKTVTYINIAAKGTIDEHVVRILGDKKDVADVIMHGRDFDF